MVDVEFAVVNIYVVGIVLDKILKFELKDLFNEDFFND